MASNANLGPTGERMAESVIQSMAKRIESRAALSKSYAD
jgi:hypothetical protein